LGLAILCALGFTLYENTVGFFLAARGRYSAKQSLLALARLPTVYAAATAIVLNLCGAEVPTLLGDLAQQLRGTYTVLGMFLVGMSAGRAKSFRFDLKLTALGLGFKFIAWPVAVGLVLAVNRGLYPFYDAQALAVFPLMAVVPLPAVSAAVAAIFDLKPQDVAVMVLISTVLALGLIPLELAVFAWLFP
ncbi:AEC family transporter, partial [bacterium]|nr:AEC family transporter [bacterium]